MVEWQGGVDFFVHPLQSIWALAQAQGTGVLGEGYEKGGEGEWRYDDDGALLSTPC